MPTVEIIDCLFSMESPSTVIHLAKCGDTVADCVAAMDAAGISKAVLAPCKRWDCERHYVCGDIQNDEVRQCVAARPDRFAGLASYNPHEISESTQRVVQALRMSDFRGVYIPWNADGVKLQDACMYPLYARCVELNVPVMVQFNDAGEAAVKMLAAIRTVLGDFPELRLILAWAAAADLNVMLAACKQHPTLSVAFDGRVLSGKEPALIEWLKADGEYRCMWGSNGLPWKKLLQHVDSYSLPETVLNSFLHGNAWRAFGLGQVIRAEKPDESASIVVAD
jgi:predicted TIM-barrel fold metal-dependent hydrolase